MSKRSHTSFKDWQFEVVHCPEQLERDSIKQIIKDWDSDRNKLINKIKELENLLTKNDS
jgi:hypothetical protein